MEIRKTSPPDNEHLEIRKTSPPLSQAEDYAAPIRPPLRRKFYQNTYLI